VIHSLQRFLSNLVANEKQKMLEAKLANIEMQLQEKKMALASEVSEVQLAKEETKNIMSKIHSVQNRMKSITKEIEDMKTQSSLSNKENSNDKYVSFPDF
jgi:chromosome segregation ATPase